MKGKTNKDYKLTFAPRDASAKADIEPSEDDWPFLFLPRRELPMTYVWPIFLSLLVGFMPLYKELRRTEDWTMDGLMFALGMGFMLLEVRSMSELSLLFGSTWLVNGVIIAAVMLFILLSNFIASKLESKWTYRTDPGPARHPCPVGLCQSQLPGRIWTCGRQCSRLSCFSFTTDIFFSNFQPHL